MKVTRGRQDFEPITIVIETLEEAQALKTVCGAVFGDNVYRNATNTIYDSLEEFNIVAIEHTGEVEFKV